MNPTVLWSSILVTDLGGLALGAWLLWGRRALARSWSDDARRWTALGLGLGVLTLVTGLALGEPFLVLRLWCHVLFCVLAPLAIARGLQRRGTLGLTLVALGLAAEGAYLWARHVEPFRLEVTHGEVVSARLAPGTALRIAVLADLQTDDLGPYEARVFAALDEVQADLVLVPGDLLQFAYDGSERAQRERETRELAALFRGLRQPPRLGFLMVGGDCEPRGTGFPEAGLRLLEDEAVAFPAERLQVIGLTRSSSRHALAPELAEAARAFDGLTLFCGHAPEFALTVQDVGVPLLCVAGHTHGGQIAVPFFGPPFTLSTIPRRMAAGGLFALGDSWLCVSRGIGMERGYAPRIRFLCRPELAVLELRASAAEVEPAASAH
ncbi:MAG: hypothetical protein EXS08_16950 [Planctomycetes bacterium]|nr:hypothetical protein [Planctomycetota bacterium]